MIEEKKKVFSIENVFKLIALTLFVTYGLQLYVKYAIDVIQVLPTAKTVFIIILRWSTIVTVGFAIVTTFFGGKCCKAIFSVLGPLVAVLNLVFFKDNMTAWGLADFGTGISKAYNLEFWHEYCSTHDMSLRSIIYAYTPWRAVLFQVEQILILILSGYCISTFIKNKEYADMKWKRIFVILPAMYLTFFYQSIGLFLDGTTTRNLVDALGSKATEFTTIHIITLIMNLVLYMGSYLIMKNKTKEEKDMFFAYLALSGVFNFFYAKYGGLGNLPLHLCNTAIIMMFVAFIFKMKGVFYFTYFVNVIGALFAMLFPNISGNFYTHESVRFYYNHIYAFVLPLLGITLKVYKRPTLGMMFRAIGWFTLYMIIVIFCNRYFTALGEDPDYFFLNTHFLFDKLKITDYSLMDSVANQVTITLPNGVTITLFWKFYLGVYAVYIALMFIMWFIYDAGFHISDAHRALHLKKKILKQEQLEVREKLNGRDLSEPLYEDLKHMLEIKNFTKVYSGAKAPSVDDFSLTIHDGEVFGFIGHNGAGKSTTIKSIVGIQSITNGHIVVDGYDVAKQPVEAKLRIGYVSDNHAVYERLTGREYINYIADLYLVSKEDRDARIEKYVKMFKLEDAIDNEIKSYSHGMKQKIVVIASLIHDPKVWILDEPLTGLDPTSSHQIKMCMRDHANRGNIVFFSSHVIEVVEKICDRICIINHGKLMCEYSLKDLKEQNITLEELYLKYVTDGEEF